MVLSERILALRRLPLFSESGDHELIMLAEVARPRTFSPGAVICEAGQIASRVLLVVSGSVESDTGPEHSQMLGMASVLFETPIDRTVRAGATGAECLALDRSHVFTLVNESPRILLAPIDSGERSL
ncbi:MAG: cyclic nucleotide-binding domain-containing protein [Bdellovibrionota bacterium]